MMKGIFSGKILAISAMCIGSVLIRTGCSTADNIVIQYAGRVPVIEPDYREVVIPRNIAPMNFIISENEKSFTILINSSNGGSLRLKSRTGRVRIPQRSWKQLVAGDGRGNLTFEIQSAGKNRGIMKYKPFNIILATEPADPYLCYRTLYPGYETWGEMRIIQRSVSDFKEFSLMDNRALDGNCINCHSFIKNKPDLFMVHARGSKAGTYFSDNKTVTRMELRTREMPGNAVYPAWHPSGKYIAFSSNMIFSAIHMRPEQNIELYDRFAILVLYDIGKNEMSVCGNNYKGGFMETYPFWSPDGRFLYYCRADQMNPGLDYRQVRYDLVRMPFDMDTESFKEPEVILKAGEINKSVSLPSVSPDGRYLVFALHDYGGFPAWHREADLHLLDLKTGEIARLSLNSNETESYHSWSSNGRWLVFSSKRDDGFTSRPYLAYFVNPDSIGKPFLLPQRDPLLYKRSGKSFNRPEFVTGRIKTGPGDFTRAAEKDPVKAVWKGVKN